ncbi:12933_t:CDS:2, partial [Gigaspora rosea]
QAKYECQEQVMDVRFMKISDPNVGNNKNRNQKENGNRINKTFNGKAMPIKNNTLPVRSGEKIIASIDINLTFDDEMPMEDTRLNNNFCFVNEVNSMNSNKQRYRDGIIKEVCISNVDHEGLNQSEKARVEYIPKMSDVINPDQSGVGDEKVVESGESSSDCRETNGVVNDIGRTLNSDCCDFLMKQWMKTSIEQDAWRHNDCGSKGPEHIIFESRLDVRKLGRMNMPGLRARDECSDQVDSDQNPIVVIRHDTITIKIHKANSYIMPNDEFKYNQLENVLKDLPQWIPIDIENFLPTDSV